MATFCKLFTNIIGFMFFTDVMRLIVREIQDNYCFSKARMLHEGIIYVVWIAETVAITYFIWR